MTLILRAHKLHKNSAVFPFRTQTTAPWRQKKKKKKECETRYWKLVLHLPLLNEPICSDIHKLNNIQRMKKNKKEEKMNLKKTRIKKQKTKNMILTVMLPHISTQNIQWQTFRWKCVTCICIRVIYTNVMVCTQWGKNCMSLVLRLANIKRHQSRKWNGTEIRNRLK